MTQGERVLNTFITAIAKLAREILAQIRNESVPWAHKVPHTCPQRAARL
jgi:hypothetical protein